MAQMDAADGSRGQYQVEVKSISVASPDVRLIELGPRSAADLPSFTAGSHIDLGLPNGMTRSYSLINPQAERHRYVIAVRRQTEGRGGSRYLHDSLRSGQALAVSVPRNNFPLDESAPDSIFIAGGIGITPVWSMIQRLHDIGRSWKLFYGARSRQDAVFADELQAIGRGEQLGFHFGPQPRLSIDSAVASVPAGTHLYCCGPATMLSAFERATRGRPGETIHLEHFAATEKPKADGEFTVKLARRGTTLAVPPGVTILDTLLGAGIDVSYSCREGVCGACETAVLSGEPLHQDLLLSQEEKAANKSMMICCSRAHSDVLVLDL
jgi:tetrachlorobenzoquinone reductase